MQPHNQTSKPHEEIHPYHPHRLGCHHHQHSQRRSLFHQRQLPGSTARDRHIRKQGNPDHHHRQGWLCKGGRILRIQQQGTGEERDDGIRGGFTLQQLRPSRPSRQASRHQGLYRQHERSFPIPPQCCGSLPLHPRRRASRFHASRPHEVERIWRGSRQHLASRKCHLQPRTRQHQFVCLRLLF